MVRGWALRAAWPLDLPDQVQVQLTVSDSSGAFFFGKKIKWSCEGDYYIPRVPMSLTHAVSMSKLACLELDVVKFYGRFWCAFAVKAELNFHGSIH